MMNQNNNTKLTYSSALTYAIENCEMPADVREKLEALRAQQEKRSNADRKPTKNQQANANLREVVMDVLRNEGKPMTVTEVFNAMSENPEVSSTQKVSALMRQLLLEGRVVKTMEKRVSYFSAV
jgi:hypothetical protein